MLFRSLLWIVRRGLGLLALCLLSGVGCSSLHTVAGHYPKCMRPTSYYVQQYCFDKPQSEVFAAAQWVLKRYKFPLVSGSGKVGQLQTRPLYIKRYSCNRKWGYVVSLSIAVKEHKGSISLKHFPDWVLQNKTPPLPTQPRREKFKDVASYTAAFDRYMKRVEGRHSILNRYVKLMKHWQGCDVRKSKRRTLIRITANVTGYPLDSYGNLVRNKAKKIKSDKTLEYVTLREVGKRLGKVKFMPRIMGRFRR